MIEYTDEQGSPEWFEARRGVITASRFKDCRDFGKRDGKPSAAMLGYAMDIARERVGGIVPAKFQNAAMKTGTEEEPRARFEYEALSGNMVQTVGFFTTDDGLFGGSPDGLVDLDGIIEVKTLVSSQTMFKALGGDISDYIEQCEGLMWLLGRKWVDLILWAPDLTPIGRQITIKRITRDDDRIAVLENDLMSFSKIVADYADRLKVAA